MLIRDAYSRCYPGNMALGSVISDERDPTPPPPLPPKKKKEGKALLGHFDLDFLWSRTDAACLNEVLL